jgi:hypothetical protein
VFLGVNTSSVIPEFLCLAFYAGTSQEEPLLNLTKKNDDDFSSSFSFSFLILSSFLGGYFDRSNSDIYPGYPVANYDQSYIADI